MASSIQSDTSHARSCSQVPIVSDYEDVFADMSDDDYEDYGDEDYQEPSTSSRPHGDASSANAAASQSSAGPSDADRNPRDTIENALRDIAQMGFSEEQREDLDAIFQQLRYFARRFAASFDQGQLRQAARIVVQVRRASSHMLDGNRH